MDLVTRLLVVGDRGCTEAAFGSYIGTNAKGARDLMSENGLPSFPTLIARIRCWHAIHRLDLGASESTVALQMGVDEVRSLRRHLRRHFGHETINFLAALADAVIALEPRTHRFGPNLI